VTLPVRTWLLLALAAACLAKPVTADEAGHPGILLGTGETDSIGDSRYGPLRFCGEYLYLHTDAGPQLIDPATRERLPLKAPLEVQRDQYGAGLADCSMAGGETILWFDNGEDTVVWQTMDGSRSGEVRGFARSALTRDVPLLDATDSRIVGISAEGRKLEANALPDGVQLTSITLDSVTEFLLTDRPIDIKLLSPHRVELDTLELAVILDVALEDETAVVRDGVILQYEVPGGIDAFLEPPHIEGEQIVFKIKRAENLKDCRLVAVTSSPGKADCTLLPKGYVPLPDRLFEQLSSNVFDSDISGSQRWFAWDELIDGPDSESGEVQFYIAPVVDVLYEKEIGIAHYDYTGDSGESPFYWCGERLWLDGVDGAVLIDPESLKAIFRPMVGADEGQKRFWGCSGEGAATIILLDHSARGMGWMTLNGKRGDITGVAHGDRSSLSYPLIAFDERVLLAIAAEGERPAAPGLPAGYRFEWLERHLLKPIVDPDELIALVRIRPGLFTLEVPGDQILIEVDTSGPEPKIGRHWRLSDLVPLGSDYFLSYPTLLDAGIEINAWRRSDIPSTPEETILPAQICRFQDMNRGPAKAECHKPSEAELPLDDRISAKRPNLSLQISPSGHWTAWAEPNGENNDEPRTVRVFVAPTAALPQ
jgi:hypothetical protein